MVGKDICIWVLTVLLTIVSLIGLNQRGKVNTLKSNYRAQSKELTLQYAYAAKLARSNKLHIRLHGEACWALDARWVRMKELEAELRHADSTTGYYVWFYETMLNWLSYEATDAQVERLLDGDYTEWNEYIDVKIGLKGWEPTQ